MKSVSLWLAAILLAVLARGARAESVSVDGSIPSYKPVSGMSGRLSSVGSDSMNNLMTLWAEGFKKIYPNVVIEIEGKGSATAPPALIAGTAQLGPMSRPMKQSEIDAFEKKHGFNYQVLGVRVAVDALAVFVHKDNPIKSLSLQEVDAIFSANRLGGYKEDLDTWGKLGLTGDFAQRPISLYGRNSASGTYGFFKEHALNKGDFKAIVKEQPGSAGVVQGVTSDSYGIGYSGIGYVTAGVKALPIAKKQGSKAVEPTQENAYSGQYPMSRYLYIYVDHKPGESSEPLTAEFIKYVLSKEGQDIVVKDGYFPLPGKIDADESKKFKK